MVLRAINKVTTGQKIEAIRKAKGLTQAEFATPLGKTGQYISLLEHGKKMPSVTLINLLLSYYDVSQEWWNAGNGEVFDERMTLAWDEKLIVEHYRKLPPAEKRKWLTGVK